jgi:hypothetical protein
MASSKYETLTCFVGWLLCWSQQSTTTSNNRAVTTHTPSQVYYLLQEEEEEEEEEDFVSKNLFQRSARKDVKIKFRQFDDS